MGLYHILSDRDAVNLLRLLYQVEVVEKRSYSLKLSDAEGALQKAVPSDALRLLTASELATSDLAQDGTYLSITNKGKEFIEVFDELIEVFGGAAQKAASKGVRVHYDLTVQEKRTLLVATEILKESGRETVPLRLLVEELFPRNAAKAKTGLVLRYVRKLEELNLMARIRNADGSFVSVTDKGYKTIKEQYLKGITI